MLKSLIRTALGLVVVLAWWTFTGDSVDTASDSVNGIPTRVWEGGAGTLSIELDTTTPAQIRIDFGENAEDESARSLDAWQDIAAGHHTFSVDVPAGVGGYVDLGAVDPKPGDSLSWRISAGDTVVDEQSQTLDAPLQEGFSFGLQAYFDDYATGTLGLD
jgi:hypothetical protein